MLCEKCKKNTATVFYRETVNGKTKSWSLCQECADELEKKGEISLDTESFWSDPFADVFGGGLLQSFFGLPAARRTEIGKTCTLCGATFDDLVREGKVGCPKCYEIFGDELEDSIRRIHGTSSHTGRVPSRLAAGFDRKKKIAALEKDLKTAIKEERFEDAAAMRDELKSLRESGENA